MLIQTLGLGQALDSGLDPRPQTPPHLGGLQQQLRDDQVLLSGQTHPGLAALRHREALATDWLLLLGPEHTGLRLRLLQRRKRQLLIGPPNPLHDGDRAGLNRPSLG